MKEVITRRVTKGVRDAITVPAKVEAKEGGENSRNSRQEEADRTAEERRGKTGEQSRGGAGAYMLEWLYGQDVAGENEEDAHRKLARVEDSKLKMIGSWRM